MLLAPKLDHIGDVIKKDILVLLEKAPRPRPVRLDQKTDSSFRLGHSFFIYVSILFSQFEWEALRYDARKIQSVLMEHPNCRKICG